MEISARGGHALAIFDVDTPVQILHHLIELLGFTDEVFWHIEESGGIAIAAHVDRRPKGFLASDEPARIKRRIHNSNYLSALEITIPSNRALWQEGSMPHFPKKYACIQGSDAHDPEEVGRRPIYIDLPTIDLASLRLAFREHETRIRFPRDLAAEGSNSLP